MDTYHSSVLWNAKFARVASKIPFYTRFEGNITAIHMKRQCIFGLFNAFLIVHLVNVVVKYNIITTNLCLKHQYSDRQCHGVLQPEYLTVLAVECICLFMHDVSCFVCCPTKFVTCFCSMRYKSRFANQGFVDGTIKISSIVVKWWKAWSRPQHSLSYVVIVMTMEAQQAQVTSISFVLHNTINDFGSNLVEKNSHESLWCHH